MLVSGNADRAVLGSLPTVQLDLVLPAVLGTPLPPPLILLPWPRLDPMTSLPHLEFPPGQAMTSRREEEGGGMRWPGGWRRRWSGWRRS